ncbi:MAG: hypothetical protein FWH17_08300 [Oscillospiraceae bacterium]|nr:hypothetical protein [Oscillospiraceae bacterium]
MECYCYETDSSFVFCVEDVENAQLEDVIQHKAWKKTDGKFLMSFPQNVFSNQDEKELISSNFSRLGQAIFESSLSGIEWETPLEMLAQKFNDNGIEWYIVGSICDTLRGINVTPSDIDIVVLTKDYCKAKDVCYLEFSDSIIAPFMGNQDPNYFVSPLKYFGRLFLAGAMIEVAADEIWDLKSRHPEHKKTVWAHYENSEYEKIMWRGHSLYLETLQHRYQIEKARNRKDRIRAIEAYMKKNDLEVKQ